MWPIEILMPGFEYLIQFASKYIVLQGKQVSIILR